MNSKFLKKFANNLNQQESSSNFSNFVPTIDPKYFEIYEELKKMQKKTAAIPCKK